MLLLASSVCGLFKWRQFERADAFCSGLSRVVHSPPLQFDEGFFLSQGDQPLFVPHALKMTDRNFLAFFPELLSARYLENVLHLRRTESAPGL